MDPATEFLVRKDRKALNKRLKKEKARIVVQARLHGQMGLLAATPKRILFVHKKRLGHGQVEVTKGDMKSLNLRVGRTAVVHIGTKAGRQLEFEMMQKQAGEAFCETIRPTPPMKSGQSVQVRKGGPMQFVPKQAKPHPRQQGTHDPLASSKQQKLERLERLKAKGLIGADEYRWQKDALER